jgi:hypothetical protein
MNVGSILKLSLCFGSGTWVLLERKRLQCRSKIRIKMVQGGALPNLHSYMTPNHREAVSKQASKRVPFVGQKNKTRK